MNNLSSYCGSVDAKIRGSDKDLPVKTGVGKSSSPWELEADILNRLTTQNFAYDETTE